MEKTEQKATGKNFGRTEILIFANRHSSGSGNEKMKTVCFEFPLGFPFSVSFSGKWYQCSFKIVATKSESCPPHQSRCVPISEDQCSHFWSSFIPSCSVPRCLCGSKFEGLSHRLLFETDYDSQASEIRPRFLLLNSCFAFKLIRKSSCHVRKRNCD